MSFEGTPNVYIIHSSVAPTIVLDLQAGAIDNGTACQGWTELETLDTFSQQWLITEIQRGVFTIQNLRSGTYLNLKGGSGENGTPVQGYAAATGADVKNQQWKICGSPESNYWFENVASGTCLSLSEEKPVPGTKVHGWKNSLAPTQRWSLRRVSRTRYEIDSMVRNNAHMDATSDQYLQDGLFILLGESFLNGIYSGTGLRTTALRKNTFGCQDFAVVAKGEVAKWGNNILRADGVSILFGIMFGLTTKGGIVSAHNWYINKDRHEIMFFDPQNGTETLDPGSKAYFTVY